MKKKIIIGVLVMGVALVAAGASYYFFFKEEKKPPRPKRDPNAWTVPPITFSMKGKTFVVPEQPETQVVLNESFSSTKYDYPKGSFALASGTEKGTIVALDEFTTDVAGGKRAVPIVVNAGGSGDFYYLAIIDDTGTEFTHSSSLFLGERLRITGINRTDNLVTVSYNVHAMGQPMAELPSISTSAIIDIGSNTFVQEGRKPWIEATQVVREFKGRYMWVQTDGETVTKPTTENAFSLVFDGPRVSLTTDCNDGSSEFKAPLGTSTKLLFGTVAATKKFCTSTEEGPYFKMIESIDEYKEDEVAQSLTFTLQDGSTMYFVKEGQKLEFEADEAVDAVETEAPAS
jgi:heat shock protein HslJ